MSDVALPFTFSEPILTPRLTLRLLTIADIDDVLAYQSRADVCEYLLFEPRDRTTVAERVSTYADSSTLAKDGDYLQLAMELSREGEPPRVIGDIYFTIASLDNQRAEIGWTLHPDFARQGYATEAASAVLGFAFDTLRLHRVYAELDPRNDSSIALCRRLGLREEGYFVKDLWFKGDWGDTGMYAMLRSEWEQRAQ
jgi:RimJ/RimL family protein N-acetyltransferase